MIHKVKKIFYSHNIKVSIMSRLRIVFRIKNKNVYSEYTRCKEYNKLQKKYSSQISEGVDTSLEQKKSNKIWICWLQGINNAPDLVKACVNSVKLSMPGKEIIILTNENISQYIEIPQFIIEKKNKGIISFAHYTDILRTALLCKYGGGWIDSTVLCTSNGLPEYIENNSLFVYKQLDIYKKDIAPVELSNWLIFSYSNNPILLLTLKLLYLYWEDHNHLTHYFIYHILFTLSARRYDEIWKKVPTFNNHSPHILQQELCNDYDPERWKQIKKMSDFHKLNRRINFSDKKNSIYNFIINTYMG